MLLGIGQNKAKEKKRDYNITKIIINNIKKKSKSSSPCLDL
jgi:hypothetical protein